MLLAAICAMALAACTQDGQPGIAGQPRGATVAFESIDGPPPGQFRELVQALNNEAQTRRLAVMSRENPSTYRVRGYLAAKVTKRETTISWVWDVFDRDDRRALRITGEEAAKGRHRDAWSAADDEMLRRIARSSMDQLAAFLTSPEVAPGTPDTEPRMVLAGARDHTPESAGIFRLFQPNADPVPTETAQPAAGPVPLPPRRPPVATTISARETLTLAASSH
ncbi:MAG: hypothetical protein ACHP7H_02285 [Hyphomicrobiales bacterium]